MGPNGMYLQELAILYYLWKVMRIGRYFWGPQKRKCHSCLSQSQEISRGLQTGHSFIPGKDGDSTGNHFQTMKDKVIWSRWHGFMNRKSCLTSFIAFYYMPSSVDEKRAADVIFINFRKAFSTFFLTDKLWKHGLDRVWKIPELLDSDGCGPSCKSQLVYPKGWYESRCLSIYISGLYDGTEQTVSFRAKQNWGGITVGPDGCAAILRDLIMLEKWGDRSFVTFHKGRCKI